MSNDIDSILTEAIKKEVNKNGYKQEVSELLISIVQELRTKGYVDKDDLTDRINRIGKIAEGKNYD